MNFENKLKRLEEIVHLLEDEKTPLEEALKLFEEGNALFKELKAYLKKAEEKIDILIKDQMGTLTTDVPFACALELIHTYSLIHDDLPAMDNDDLRRGKPTCHKVFGEAIAILAGDGLFSHAYYLMTLTDVNKKRLLEAIKTISNAVGSLGIVGGQTMDIKMKGERPHSRKTACFISASCEIGGILAGTSKKKREALRKGGLYLGMAFQIIDDLLDVIGDEKKVGKRLRKDKDKVTYPALYGVDGSRFRAKAYTELAIKNFKKLGDASDKLVEISKYLEQRMF